MWQALGYGQTLCLRFRMVHLCLGGGCKNLRIRLYILQKSFFPYSKLPRLSPWQWARAEKGHAAGAWRL